MTNKDFFDGKWHVAVPFDNYKKDPEDISMIDMAGLDPNKFKRVKIGHCRMRALMVEVDSEEKYRAIMRPIRAELRKKIRQSRCLVPDGKGGMIRCPEKRDCATCNYQYAGYTYPESLNQYNEDAGFEAAADESLDLARCFDQNSFITELNEFVRTLSDEEQIIARAILTECPDKEVMKELNIEKQSTYSSRKIKVKKKLQKRFADWR